MDLIEQVAKAMWDVRRAHANNAGIDLEFWGDGTFPKANGIMEEARAAIEAMAELPEEPGPNYTAGEYSRRNIKAMVDDALLSKKPQAPVTEGVTAKDYRG